MLFISQRVFHLERFDFCSDTEQNNLVILQAKCPSPWLKLRPARNQIYNVFFCLNSFTLLLAQGELVAVCINRLYFPVALVFFFLPPPVWLESTIKYLSMYHIQVLCLLNFFSISYISSRFGAQSISTKIWLFTKCFALELARASKRIDGRPPPPHLQILNWTLCISLH